MPSINSAHQNPDPTSRRGDKVIVIVAVAVLTYFALEALVVKIDRDFHPVMCKATYYAPPK